MRIRAESVVPSRRANLVRAVALVLLSLQAASVPAQVSNVQTKVEQLADFRGRIVTTDVNRVGRIETEDAKLSVVVLRLSDDSGHSAEGVRFIVIERKREFGNRIIDYLPEIKERFERGVGYADSDEAHALAGSIERLVGVANQRRGDRMIQGLPDEVPKVQYVSVAGIRFYIYLSERGLHLSVGKAVINMGEKETQQFLELLRKSSALLSR